MRGSILERDLSEISSPNGNPDDVKKTLDHLSGDDFRLVDRKFAIVCNDTQEIIFLLRRRDEIENAKNLQCPRCANVIGDESVMLYYAVTDELKALIDGNRWMPMLVREALIKAGISADDIYTEVKHGEDEIDVLAFYGRRVFVMEVKNRPVNLNDAYKLSAKSSRLEKVASRASAIPTSNPDLERVDDDDEVLATYVSPRASEVARDSFVPVVISTHDIVKDARDLLTDTNEQSRFLDNSDGKIEGFIESIVGEIDAGRLETRLESLTSERTEDSTSSLAAGQIQVAFQQWLEHQKAAE